MSVVTPDITIKLLSEIDDSHELLMVYVVGDLITLTIVWIIALRCNSL